MVETTWTGIGEHLVWADLDGVAVLRIDRPSKLNALSPGMLAPFAAAIRSLAETSRGLVITGTGRAFSAGDDLDATADLDEIGFTELIAGFQDLTRAVLDTEVPVIAALNGIAVGGAAELTLACDARIGSPSSALLFPENRVGLTISNGSTFILPRLVGGAALPIILDAERIDSKQAFELGLLNAIESDPVTASVERIRRWVELGSATAWHLRMLRPDRASVEIALDIESRVAAEIFATGIPTSGAAAFRDRRR